jgi:hypothetical protein
MLAIAAAVLALGSSPAVQADTLPRDTTRRQQHSVNVGPAVRHRARPLTPELLANAYADPRAREVIARARAARLAQDSSIQSYDSRARQRLSVGMSLREGARGRLMYRSENAWRVRWQRGVGARVQVLGARSVVPMVNRRPGVGDEYGDPAIPYFPGREGLLFFAGMQRVGDTTDVYLVHPLDPGSEAAYRFASGDSSSIRLPDGSRVRLVEVRVEARRPDPDLLVGSLWFDEGSGQLVRAGFRPAAPLDLTAQMDMDDPGEGTPGWVKAMLNPLTFSSDGFFVEYGLHKGRFWMPHSQGMEGMVRVGMMRMPVRVEERFDYADVNGTMQMAAIAPAARDSAAGEPGTAAALKAKRHRRDACSQGQQTRSFVRKRYDGTLPVEVTVPCDTAALVASAELPGSIYTPDEQLFGGEQRQELMDALGFGLQAGWGPGRPVVRYGAGGGLLRYNRVEGLAPAVQVDEALGRGYSARALLRVGLADPVPTGELALTRAAGTRTYTVAAYRRLAAANDWGDPLGLGGSLAALLFGRDEGFYYHTLGAELAARPRPGLDWRLFAERQTPTRNHTDFSLASALGADGFEPNIRADEGNVVGLSIGGRHDWGSRPGGFRLSTSSRFEGALGDFRYVREMVDATVAHGLFAGLDGALTAAGGSSSGTLPVQRLWYLGGAYTVRGQCTGAAVGDAFWLGRAEVGTRFAAFRPVVFYDVGWAGPRDLLGRGSERPLQGVGAGISMLDGMFRVDVSRGLTPGHDVRVDAYLEARF